MSLLDSFFRPFFWRPAGCVPALEDPGISRGVLTRRDVTTPVGASTGNRHPLSVVELAGGKIIGDLRLVVTTEDVVVGGLQSLFGCREPQDHYLLHRRRFRRLKYRRGTAWLLGAGNSDNYYHWMMDSLPRWRMLQLAGYRDYDYVLLHHLPRPFQEETLDRLGVPPAKRLRCSKRWIHQFERLVAPAMPFPPEEVPAWACAWIRSLFPERVSGPEKIYLSRQDVRGRQVANEPELQAALEKVGFVTIQPEQLTVAEQAKHLSSARWVVAPHGAALTNLIFAAPGATLLELFHPQHKNRCYVNLAAACGHRYLSLDGRPIRHANARQLAYTVEVPAVLQAIVKAS